MVKKLQLIGQGECIANGRLFKRHQPQEVDDDTFNKFKNHVDFIVIDDKAKKEKKEEIEIKKSKKKTFYSN